MLIQASGSIMIERGLENNGERSQCNAKITSLGESENQERNRSKPKRIKVMVGAKDGFKIDGFGESRKCEFDDGNNLIKSPI